MRRPWLLLVVLLAYAWQDARTLPSWQSNAALWARLYVMTPGAPWVARNHASQLWAQDQVEAAQRILQEIP